MVLLGELAALGTSVCWSFTSTFFTLSGRLVGSAVVNRMRLLMAIGFLMLAHQLFMDTALPLDVGLERWMWFALSGILGLVIGDAFLFQAFVLIGARLSMLLMSLVPVVSAILAWFFLDEFLAWHEIIAIGITVFGVAWVVVVQRSVETKQVAAGGFLVGVLFGLGGATGQALGLITAKQGLAGDFSALSGTLMRMISAAIVLWIFTALTRRIRYTFRQLELHPRALRYILAGAFFGPFLGVTLSLIAVQQTDVGVAATLMSLTPIFLIPVSYFVFHERIGWQAIAGTLMAVFGVALLLLG